MKIYDISVPLSPSLPVYPGDPATEFHRHSSIAAGDSCNLTRISLSSHAGTHIDAPRHFLQEGKTVEEIPPELLIGPSRVSETDAREIGPRELTHLWGGSRRLLLKTAGSRLWGKEGFSPDYSFLTREGAEFLVREGVQLVGIDYLSIEGPQGDGEVHRILLGAGVVILEGLDLSRVPPGKYQLVCLPLKIAGGDGAPARALLVGAGDAGSDFDPHTTRWPVS